MIVDPYAHIVPYDPASPKGKEVAAALTRVLDDIEIELATRAAIAAVESTSVRRTAAA